MNDIIKRLRNAVDRYATAQREMGRCDPAKDHAGVQEELLVSAAELDEVFDEVEREFPLLLRDRARVQFLAKRSILLMPSFGDMLDAYAAWEAARKPQ